MAIVVIGGHSRNIGKTGAVCSLISALPERHWTAIKITQFGHRVCSANGQPCECDTGDHTIAISEERNRSARTDSSRYLTAGALRSFWVRTRQGQLADAMPRVRKILADAQDAILESNSVLRFLHPDVYAAVLDPGVTDFKLSSLRYLDRADAIVLTRALPDGALTWPGVSPRLVDRVPRFHVSPPSYSSEEFIAFVARKIQKAEDRSLPPVELHNP